eukprot:jgi/Mesvir1/14991/Mv14650-RA.1
MVPIRHCVLLSFTDAATEEQKKQLKQELDKLPSVITVIKSYRTGPDLGLAEGNKHFGITADFACKEDFITYRDHPAHVEVITKYIKPILASRAAMQFELPTASL